MTDERLAEVSLGVLRAPTPGAPPVDWLLPSRGTFAPPAEGQETTKRGITEVADGSTEVDPDDRSVVTDPTDGVAAGAAAPTRQHPATIEVLVRQDGQALMRLAYMLTGDRTDAEDLFQETLVDVHRKWSKVEAAAHPYAYVRAMMTNRHTSARRRRWTGEQPTDPVEMPLPPHQSHLADPAHRVDSDDALWHLLARLPERMRTVLVLRYFEDLDDAEIARILGLRVSTVRASASRALARLREKGELP